MGDKRDRLQRHLERVARREVASIDDGVAFAFGAAEPGVTELRRLAERFEQAHELLQDPDRQILVVSESSSPGASDLNRDLSDRRGEWLRQWLVDHGVAPDRIRVESRGERDADPLGDSAYDRLAVWRIEEVAPPDGDAPSPMVAALKERFDRVAEDRAAGERMFGGLLAGHLHLIRELHKLPDNPVFPDPSANPHELLKQAGQIVFDIWGPPTSPEEFALEEGMDASEFLKYGELAGGALAGIARDNLRDEVAAQRRPLLDAYEQAIAAALDPGHALKLDGMDPLQRALATALFNQVAGLPFEQKYQLGLFLAEAHRSAIQWLGPPELSYLESRLDGRNFAMGADSVFSGSEYRHRSNDPGALALFPLSISVDEGRIAIRDITGRVLGSAEVESPTGALEVMASEGEDDEGGVSLAIDAGDPDGSTLSGDGDDEGGVSLVVDADDGPDSSMEGDDDGGVCLSADASDVEAEDDEDEGESDNEGEGEGDLEEVEDEGSAVHHPDADAADGPGTSGDDADVPVPVDDDVSVPSFEDVSPPDDAEVAPAAGGGS